MEDDMDVNAGRVLEGKLLREVGDEVRDILVRVLNGRRPRPR
jgi:altronate dehydratase